MSRPQLAYVLPEYDPGTPTHFAHLYDLLAELAKTVDVHLVVERGGAPEGPFASVTVLRHGGLARLYEEYGVLAKLRQNGCERFYVHYSFAGAVAAGIVARSYGGRSFYWNCGLHWLYTPALGRGPLRGWLRYRLPLLLAMWACHYVVTGTEGVARGYSREYGIAWPKFRVLPNWVNLRRFGEPGGTGDVSRYGLPPGTPAVTFIHRLSERKGAQMVVPIAAAMQNREAALLVAGSGPYRKKLQQEIAAAGLGERVKLLGDVPNVEVPQLLRSSTLFIMPSDEEGFPRVLLEAMACGVPFVATNVGGVPEIVPPGSSLVAAGDAAGFAAAVDELLASPGRRAELADSGRRWVQRYSLSQVAEQFMSTVVRGS